MSNGKIKYTHLKNTHSTQKIKKVLKSKAGTISDLFLNYDSGVSKSIPQKSGVSKSGGAESGTQVLKGLKYKCLKDLKVFSKEKTNILASQDDVGPGNKVSKDGGIKYTTLCNLLCEMKEKEYDQNEIL